MKTCLKPLITLSSIALIIFLFCFSCKKEDSQTWASSDNLNAYNDSRANKKLIAKVMAKTLEKDPLVRSFLKEKSLLMFDNDHDVFYQLVKNEKLSDGVTFYQKLVENSASKEDLDAALNDLPLLTFLVPTLPNFSPEEWDTQKSIPLVAVEPGKEKNKRIEIYDGKGKLTTIRVGYVPAFAVIVVKDNERIIVSNSTSSFGKSSSTNALSVGDIKDIGRLFLTTNGLTFSYANDIFDGTKEQAGKLSKENSASTSGGRPPKGEPVPNVRIEQGGEILPDFAYVGDAKLSDLQWLYYGYKTGREWQRDYIYYGIDEANNITKGAHRSYYRETIASLRMLTGPEGYDVIKNGANDPAPKESYKVVTPPRGTPRDEATYGYWTDGVFEFTVKVLINSTNGAGPEANYHIAVKPSDLFETTLIPENGAYRVLISGAKVIKLDIPIVSWDLEEYGSAWKFVVAEYDPVTVKTEKHTNSSTFSTNFGIDAGIEFTKVKLTPKFGGSTQTVKSHEFTVQTTTESNQLGSAVLDFRNPVFAGYYLYDKDGDRRIAYKPFEINTGTVCLGIVPREIPWN